MENKEDKLTEEMKEWKNHVEEMRLDAGRQLDKQIVYLSGGGLVLSISFIKDIIGVDSTPDSKCLLIVAWISFTLSLITNLFSFKTTSNSFNYAMIENDKLTNRYHRITSILNWLSIATLICGLISFIIFVVVNF